MTNFLWMNILRMVYYLKKELLSLKISTKGRYGLVAVIYLAMHYEEGHIPLNIVAERQGLSSNYLEHIFSSLKKAGIVKSIKGAQGGYILADKPSHITTGAVLRALEGDLSIASREEESEGRSIEGTLRINLWDKIDAAVNSIVDTVTLEDIVQHYNAGAEGSFMFHI